MKLFYTLVASALIHTLIWLWSQLAPSGSPVSPRKPIVVEYLKPKQSYVTQAQLPENLRKSLEDLKKKAKFLSLKHQRVEQETVAKNSGDTRNRPPENQASPRRAPPQKNSQRSPLNTPQTNDLEPQYQQQPIGRNVVFGGPSSISEHIPNVREGSFTALNQDQFLHYSFYSRVNQRIKYRWINGVKNFVRDASYSKLKGASTKSQITRIEVLLDKQGEYIRTIIHKSSDFPELDQAAINAFLESAPHLNPPEEMVKKDGMIHLHYSLYVMFAPRFMADKKNQ